MTEPTTASTPDTEAAAAAAPADEAVARTADVTGAASERGIGMAVAERYAREGWAIVVLDVAHVTAAGDDLAATIADWQGRIAHVHLRDAVRGDFSRRIGEGDVDFAAAFSALDEIGYSGGFALEQPSRA